MGWLKQQLLRLEDLKLNTKPSIGASHHISIHLAKQFQRRWFKEIDQPETRIAYDSHVC
jgi:hypothetical protein